MHRRLRTVICPETPETSGLSMRMISRLSASRLIRESASMQRSKSAVACLNARLRALHFPPFGFRKSLMLQLLREQTNEEACLNVSSDEPSSTIMIS